MKEQENKKRDPLRDLLAKKPEELHDDFEKDAVEGFSSLSAEEISQLRNSMDKRAALLFEEKKSKRFITWPMAAGFALIVGLTAFFLRDSFFKEDESAISLTRTKAEIGSASQTTSESSIKQTIEEKEVKKEQTEPVPSPQKKQKSAPDRNDDSFGEIEKKAAEAATTETNENLALTSINEPQQQKKTEQLASDIPAQTEQAQAFSTKASRIGTGTAPPSAAPPQMEEIARSAGNDNSAALIEKLLHEHFMTLLPSKYRKSFTATFLLDAGGQISNFTLSEPYDFGKQTAEEIIKLANKSVVKGVESGNLVYDSRFTKYSFRP